MRIEKIEKVVLTSEEVNTLDKALSIIDDVYTAANSKGELEKQTSNIITALTDFLDEVNVDLKKWGKKLWKL